METQHHHKKIRDKKEKGEEKLKQEGKESNSSSTKQQLTTINNSSPPSASSSPSHEFSFTVSVHPSSAAMPDKTKAATATATATTAPPSFAIDLSPADDIFFHGHLLPLHLLSHLPISPRSSINSLDSFSLPIKDLLDGKPNKKDTNNNISNNGTDDSISNGINNRSQRRSSKAKSFPLFGLARWRKGCEVVEKENKEEEDQMKVKKKKKKVRLNVAHILRRYIRMVRPLLVFRGRRDNQPLRRQPYSFSGNLIWKGKQEWKGRREHSAPASMWTSPTNSGLLVATTTTALHTSKSDSTMEELQSAIQAAIAHCKNSIAVEEKLKC